MIYIHGLSQLSPKTVDIESVPIIREIKRNIAFPASNERVKEHFSPFFVYKADTDIMEKSLSLVNPTILEIRSLLGKNDSDFEAINLNRAWKMLEEVSTPLRNNIAFSKEITEWQDSFIGEAANIFNTLRRLKTHEEKINFNNKLNLLFMKILRNKEMAFRHNDLIGEAHVERIKDLKKMLENGFIFHIKLEEEMNKTPFFIIKKRIPTGKLAYSDRILMNVLAIKEGIDKAYETNMSMIKWAVTLYSYIKIFKTFPY